MTNAIIVLEELARKEKELLRDAYADYGEKCFNKFEAPDISVIVHHKSRKLAFEEAIRRIKAL